MSDLSRSQFCELTRLPLDTLKSLARRGQTPFSVDQKNSGRGYTFFEAFLTIVSQEFYEGHGVNVTRAAEIAAALPEVLAPKWSRVVETAHELANGSEQKIVEIMCGRYSPAGLHQPRPIVGTDNEIDEELAAMDMAAVRSIRSSATRCLTVLINRSQRLQIDIPNEFWTTPFSYRERPSTAGLAMENMKMLIAEDEHLESTND